MRKNKTLSSFSIAAIALLAAAVPGFAQTQSTGSRAEAKSGVTVPGSSLELAFNRESRSIAPRTGFVFVEPKNLADTSAAFSSKALSAAAFKVTGQFTAKENKFSFDPQFSRYNSKPQFRADEESGVTQSKSNFSFVPSRGPKVPS